MKNKSKSHKTGKGKKHGGKGKKRHHRRALSGLGVIQAHATHVVKDAVHPLAILLGYGGGAFVGRMLDKVDAITPDAAAEGFQWKSLIKPVILLGGGITISAVAHHMGKKEGKELGMGAIFIKNFGYGITVSGGVALVKGVIKKDLFDGLGAASASIDAKYLEESKALLKKLVEDAGKEVNLPALEEGTNGVGSTVIPAFDTNKADYIL